MLSRYKEWVKRHPGVVQNLDWLLLLTVWNPSRTNGGFEFTYEAYHAAVGLLSLWHQSVLEEGELPTSRPSPYLWLDAIEYVETLIELRGMHLESQGKMSRYGPLMVVEAVKAVLKMAAWSRYSGHMFLRRPSPDDLHQFESELGMQDILASLERLRRKYTAAPGMGVDGAVVSGLAVVAAAAPAAGAGGDGGARGPAVASSTPAPAAAAAANVTITSTTTTTTAMRDAAAATRCVNKSCGCGGGASYGLREYVAEQLGWVRALMPGRSACGAERTGAPQDGGSCAEGTSEPRAASGDGCSTSHRCGSGGGGSSSSNSTARRDPWATGVASDWPSLRQCHGGASSGPCGEGPRVEALSVMGFGCRVPPVLQQRQEAGEDPDSHMGRNLLWLSELLYIWRPVVYVTMLKRYGRRSWKPWLVSLAVDLLSGHFHRRGRQHLAEAAARAAARAAEAEAGGLLEYAADAGDQKAEAAAARGRAPKPPPMSGAGTSLLSLALARSLAAPGITVGEERELYDRRRKLLLYGLRSPFLEATTLSWLSALRNATRRMPLVGFGADYLYGLVDTFTAYYSYTSGSN